MMARITAIDLLLCLLLLTLGPQVGLSYSNISFSSVEQCSSFSVLSSGSLSSETLPFTLEIIPFQSTPFSIALPNHIWNNSTNSTSVISFLPLAAGTEFVAQLNDASGNRISLISDIVQVLSSENNSCVPSDTNSSPAFNVSNSFSQCQPFNVTYSTNTPAPSVYALVPGGNTFTLPQTVVSPGLSTYIMTAFHGEEVVLLLSDNVFAWVTEATTVEGGSSSSSACLNMQQMVASSTSTSPTASASTSMTTAAQSSLSAPKQLSMGTVIGIAVASACIIAGIAILMAIYIYRHRHREWIHSFDGQVQGGDLEDVAHFVPATPPKPLPMASSIPRLIKNPPYSTDKVTFRSPATSQLLDDHGECIDSLQPQTGRSLTFPLPPPCQHTTHSTGSLDIERILEMATIHSQARSSFDALSTISTIRPPQRFRPDVPPFLHRRDPSDVPLPADGCSIQLSPSVPVYPTLGMSALHSRISVASLASAASCASVTSQSCMISNDSNEKNVGFLAQARRSSSLLAAQVLSMAGANNNSSDRSAMKTVEDSSVVYERSLDSPGRQTKLRVPTGAKF